MKKLPLGIQNFRKIVEGDYVYVDKTQYIYNLINGASYYFLSRPRRFGKSLLLDTIGEAFSGDKELFKGLWIYDSDYEFKKLPVIRLDMSNMANKTPEILMDALKEEILHFAEKELISISGSEPSTLFKRLIEGLYQKHNQRVVVLIDEYDKPILDHITDIEIAEANRQELRGFYGILKSMDPYLRLTFITGVSKFTKTSIFSELNNLLDITLTEDYSTICGVVIDDLEKYFGEHIEDLSKLKSFEQYDDITKEILAWYDGYSWDGKTKVINPFSLLSFFTQKRFAGFWYASGTPRFLVELIKKRPETYANIRDWRITEDMLDSVELDRISVGCMLFQTGYLTIKDIPPTFGMPIYLLDMPNFEVREAFNLHILSAFSEKDAELTGQFRMDMTEALHTGDLQKMLELMHGFFASIPYELHVDLEAYYHSIFYALMTVLGFDMSVEVSVSKGRVDAILELGDKVYVMEFKYKKSSSDASAEEKQKLFVEALDEAMKQINDKEYAAKYIGSGKTIYKAAFAFLGRGDIEMRVASEKG